MIIRDYKAEWEACRQVIRDQEQIIERMERALRLYYLPSEIEKMKAVDPHK